MLRNAFRLIIFLAVAFFIRRVIQMIMGEFSKLSQEEKASAPPPGEPIHGELKKDPVCGTFVAVASSIKRDVDGQVVHFCSTACRDKYQAA